jgi:hypothetical protein
VNGFLNDCFLEKLVSAPTAEADVKRLLWSFFSLEQGLME